MVLFKKRRIISKMRRNSLWESIRNMEQRKRRKKDSKNSVIETAKTDEFLLKKK